MDNVSFDLVKQASAEFSLVNNNFEADGDFPENRFSQPGRRFPVRWVNDNRGRSNQETCIELLVKYCSRRIRGNSPQNLHQPEYCVAAEKWVALLVLDYFKPKAKMYISELLARLA